MAFPETDDLLLYLVVIAARILIPLAIPRWPLPAILAVLLLDAADQTLFQNLTGLNLTNYQGYDKALDVYYLAIAYLSTLRNWADPTALGIGRCLFYVRLVGVALFEFSQLRPLLFLFPNTFEYFFIAYEAVRLRWDPRRLGGRHLVGAAAAIWIAIKLPQEYWLHVAQRDTTDFIKERLFGVPLATGWGEIVASNVAVFVALGLALLLLAALGRWTLRTVAPPADWSLTFDPDAHNGDVTEEQVRAAGLVHAQRLFDRELVEKLPLVTLVTVTFAQTLPGVRVSNLQFALGVAVVIVANTALTEWMLRSGVGWPSIVLGFFVLAIVNLGIVVAFDLVLLPFGGGQINLGNTLFFALLLTLLVTLYDRYQPFHAARLAAHGSDGLTRGAAGPSALPFGERASWR